jgi:oligopeptide/dipeptide ABC transporter ATP-binding protein
VELSASALKSVSARVNVVPQPLLQVRDLTVRISADATHEITPVDGVSFQVGTGEVLGLLGESGAGKTTLGMALLCLIPPRGAVLRGSIEFEGRSLLDLEEPELRKIRGSRISLIYQDSTVLNPVLRVGTQLVEVLRAHNDWSKRRCREKAMALLEDVDLRDVDRTFAAYPHQLSGGQRQRIVIAQALACRPALVVGDEPTASLDPGIAKEILDLLGRLKQRFQTSFLLISHDLAPLEYLADRVMVMYAGKIVEQGPRDQVLQQPLHPYTRALLACSLRHKTLSGSGSNKQPVPTIPGAPPDRMQVAAGCDFACRCPERMDICDVRTPEETEPSATQAVRCFKFGG